MLSPYGGSANNYNHQGAQSMVEGEILWMMDHYNIDSKRLIPETKGEEDPLSKQTQINNGIEDGSSSDSFLEINRRVDFEIFH